MAWTDLSSTLPGSWDANAPGDAGNYTNVNVSNDIYLSVSPISTATAVSINSLERSFNIPGFTGFEPNCVPNPIANNIDQGQSSGGGGSVRPTSGMMYPRGQG